MFQLDRIRFRVFAQGALPKLISKIRIRTIIVLGATDLVETSGCCASRGECGRICEKQCRNRRENARWASCAHSCGDAGFPDAGQHTMKAAITDPARLAYSLGPGYG